MTSTNTSASTTDGNNNNTTKNGSASSANLDPTPNPKSNGSKPADNSNPTSVAFMRWLENHGLGDFINALKNLDITTMHGVLCLTHPQLIEVGRQLAMTNIRQVLFAEAVVNHADYKLRHTIREDGEVALAYKLVHITNKLKQMGMRDNWDNATDEIYTMIDECKSIRDLISFVEQMLKIDKNDYVSWDLHGLLHARRGFLADARVCFQRALVKNPTYLHARFNHARLLHYELREYDRAKSEYECIIRIKPNFSRAYNSYAKLMEKTGDLEKAEKYFRHAIELRPKSISYRHGLANILASRNRHLEIQQVYQESVRQHPKSATLRFHHALALVKCKYLPEAEMEFKNAIKLNSHSAQMYHEYAKYCERHRQPPDYKKATDLYFKACSCDPVHYLKAAVDAANLMRRLDTEASRKSAEQLFAKLVSEAPHLNDAFLGYGKLLVREQRFTEAAEILRTGIGHHPKDEPLRKYYTEFQQLLAKEKEHEHEHGHHTLQVSAGPGTGNQSNVHNGRFRPSILYEASPDISEKQLKDRSTHAQSMKVGHGNGGGGGGNKHSQTHNSNNNAYADIHKVRAEFNNNRKTLQPHSMAHNNNNNGSKSASSSLSKTQTMNKEMAILSQQISSKIRSQSHETDSYHNSDQSHSLNVNEPHSRNTSESRNSFQTGRQSQFVSDHSQQTHSNSNSNSNNNGNHNNIKHNTKSIPALAESEAVQIESNAMMRPRRSASSAANSKVRRYSRRNGSQSSNEMHPLPLPLPTSNHSATGIVRNGGGYAHANGRRNSIPHHSEDNALQQNHSHSHHHNTHNTHTDNNNNNNNSHHNKSRHSVHSQSHHHHSRRHSNSMNAGGSAPRTSAQFDPKRLREQEQQQQQQQQQQSPHSKHKSKQKSRRNSGSVVVEHEPNLNENAMANPITADGKDGADCIVM